ncbi:hypothetical protein [Micromonospora sp. CPCC 206061]|uniref:hypothetical protein n=1 Tax=Micromonospora sp. CPCC 206061 TaxID=3122410 RepID=UPI002FF2080D
MRTEEDLRAMFAAREELAPDQHLVLEGTRQVVARRRRRRTVGAAAAAAVVVAAALPVAARQWSGPSGQGTPIPGVGAPAGSTASSEPAGQVPSGPRPPFAFTIRPSSIAGFEIQPTAVNPDLQIASVRGVGQTQTQAELYVYRPGTNHRAGWDLSRDPVPVQVNGAPAWYSVQDTRSAIRWQHTPGGWAVINTSGSAMPKQTLIGLAQAVQFTTPYPAKVPYRLSYLPAGFKPFQVAQGIPGAATARTAVQFQAQGGNAVMDIAVLDGSPSGRPGWRADLTMAGRPAQCTGHVDGHRCAVDFGAFTVDVGSRTVPRTEIAEVVAGMSFADWRDPGTWYDIDTAIPSR